MTEQNTENKYPVAEKQAMAVGVPFKVIIDKPKTLWITNYAYYMKQKREGGPLKPLLGRKPDDNTFEVYIDGQWVQKDLWNDFSEPMVDGQGNPVMGKNGKQRKQLLFDEKKEWLLKFERPVQIEYWNSEQGKKVVEEHEVVWVRMSNNLSGKLEKEVEDPRSPTGSYFQLDRNPNAAPAEQYSAKFVRGPDAE